MKQALVRQGMYREQENIHLEWPDHTMSQLAFVEEKVITNHGVGSPVLL